MELRGPQRWRIKANWKIGAENFAGDSYHTPHTHASVVDIGLFREPKASKRKEGALYLAGPGAGTTYKLPPGGGFADQLRYVGYPDAMIPAMAAAWSDRQRALVADSGFMLSAATLFPNLSFVHNWPQIDADGTVVPRSSRCASGSRSASARPRSCPGSRWTRPRRRTSSAGRTRPT